VNLFYQPLISRGILHLNEEESKHCVKVLRQSKGDAIRITDGAGFFYDCVIEDPSPAACRFSIKGKFEDKKHEYFIHIAISPTKNTERIDWFVEKATELGIDKITPLETERTERPFLKQERLQKVALAAMKQSLKARMPHIGNLTKLKDLLNDLSETERFIAHVDEGNALHLKDAATPGQSYLVLIGPEGDFSKEELNNVLSHNFTKVSLGKSRLRTETAGLSACHILNLINS
jgi:16S rRNA (uracil1498-N3)-methyltransferase